MKKIISLVIISAILLSGCMLTNSKPNEFIQAQDFEQQNKYSKAIEFYKKAIVSQPKYADSYINLVNILLKKNQIDEALEIASLGVQYAQPLKGIATLQGDIFIKKGQLTNAQSSYEKALTEDSGFEAAVVGKLNSLGIQNKSEDMKQFASSYQTGTSFQASTYSVLAVASFTDPTQMVVFVDKAKALNNSDLSQEEISELQKDTALLKDDKDSLLALAKISYFSLKKGWLGVALPVVSKMNEVNKYYEGALLYKALILNNTNQGQEAVKLLEEANTYSPDDATILANLAVLYLQNSTDQAKAVSYANNALKSANMTESLLDFLCGEFIKKDKYAEASTFIKTYISAKELAQIHESLNFAYILLEDNDSLGKAEEVISKLNSRSAEMTEDQKDNLLTLSSFLLYKKSDKTKALEQLQNLKKQNKSLALIYLYLARIYKEQGMQSEMQEAKDAAIEYDFTGIISAQVAKLNN